MSTDPLSSVITPFYDVSALDRFESPFRREPLTKEQAYKKMLKNTQKAFVEHRAQETLPQLSPSSIYSPLNPASFSSRSEKPLKVLVYSASAKGSRSHMEDVSLFCTTPTGVAFGVFDGHSGDKVAKYASARFAELFPSVLRRTDNHTHKALEVTTGLIQQEILKDPSMDKQGSTAAIAAIDVTRGELIAATLGDSEVNVYREDEGRTFSHPASLIRDWAHPKDKARALALAEANTNNTTRSQVYRAIETNKAIFSWDCTTPKDGKYQYVCSNDFSQATNVARAYGKKNFGNISSHKPKITSAKLQKDDVIVVASDGLKDRLEHNIAHIVSRRPPQNLAKALVDHGVSVRNSDNVGVVVAQVK